MNEANKYAQTQADAFRETLQYLVDTQNEQKIVITKYNNATKKIDIKLILLMIFLLS